MVTPTQPCQLLCLDTVWILQELDGKNFFLVNRNSRKRKTLIKYLLSGFSTNWLSALMVSTSISIDSSGNSIFVLPIWWRTVMFVIWIKNSCKTFQWPTAALARMSLWWWFGHKQENLDWLQLPLKQIQILKQIFVSSVLFWHFLIKSHKVWNAFSITLQK